MLDFKAKVLPPTSSWILGGLLLTDGKGMGGKGGRDERRGEGRKRRGKGARVWGMEPNSLLNLREA